MRERDVMRWSLETQLRRLLTKADSSQGRVLERRGAQNSRDCEGSSSTRVLISTGGEVSEPDTLLSRAVS